MPLYSYYCQDCDRTVIENRLMIERDQKPLPPCEFCGEETKFVLAPVAGYVKNPAAGRTRRG